MSDRQSIGIGIIGTGFAAQRRAEAFTQDERSRLVAAVGHTPESTQAFCESFNVPAVASPQTLINDPEIDLVTICTINSEHGAIAQAALEAGKHVVVEYPLALDPDQAESLIALSQRQGKLLHVEHIELLGGLHQAIRQALPEIGNPFYARYSTLVSQHPAPQRWTYRKDLFGFPLSGALSRIHRLSNLFGAVSTVSCYTRYWENRQSDYFSACLCDAQLRFASGLVATVTYGKGDAFWQSARTFEIHGDQGTLIFEGDRGMLVQDQQQTPIEVGGRRGLFAKDTAMVLDHLTQGTPLYVHPQASAYALRVGDAARQSAETGKTVFLEA